MKELTVSNSEMRTFKHCRRKWYFQYVLRWGADPAYANPVSARDLGTRVHCALEAYYGYGIDPIAALEFIYSTRAMERPEYADELRQESQWAITMVSGFLDWAAEEGLDETHEVVKTETVVSVPIHLPNDTTANVMGKLDQLVRRRSDGALQFRDWKPQPVSEQVLTPHGWVRMGDIVPGDLVCGARGESLKVINVYDRGVDDIFKITMNDGTSVRATADHPWLGRVYPAGAEKIIETSDLRRGSRLARYEPMRSEGAADLPVNPYALGAWIANGSRDGSVITDGESEPMYATGMRVREQTREGHKLQYLACVSPEMRRSLQDLGLLWKYSKERFIPDSYIHGTSHEQRLALLRGLMDGDGVFNPGYRSSAYYSTVSEQLAGDVAALVRSLGGWAKVWTNPVPTYTGTTERRVIIRSSFNPFEHVAHASTWPVKQAEVAAKAGGGRGKHGLLSQDKIVWTVEPDGREAVRCIEVDSDDHLYVTSGYTVTHNTTGTLGKANGLVRDEQMRLYSLLMLLESGGGYDRIRVDGGLYFMLLRSKRTARAKGPFYEQIEVSYNTQDHRSMQMRVKGTLMDMQRVHEQLESGADHREVAYPNADERCEWMCPFSQVCSLHDDGSRADAAMQGNFVQQDPYSYYGDSLITSVKKRFGAGASE